MTVEEMIDSLMEVKDKTRKVMLTRVGNSPLASLHVREIEYTNTDTAPVNIRADRTYN